MAGGLLCAAEGLAVMAAWFARTMTVFRFDSSRPIVFNGGLAVAATGVALLALARRWPKVVRAGAVFDAALGATTLAEYALGRGLGIDQLIVKAHVSGPHDVPGRMYLDAARPPGHRRRQTSGPATPS